MTDAGVLVERFADYREEGKPYVDEVEYVFDVRGDAAVDGVLRGDLAYTRYVPRSRMPELIADPDLRSRIQWITLPQCLYLLMNADEGHLSDPRIRQAISHAIDRRRVVEHYNTAPIATAAEGLVPPTCPGFDPHLAGPAHDPVLARALLEEAGYDFERPIALVLSEGMWALGRSAADVVIEDLQAIGLRVDATFSKHLNARRENGDFDLLEASWVGDYLDPDTFTYGPFHSQFGSFRLHHGSHELDDLFQRARSTTDISRRARLYARIHSLFNQVCPAVVLLHRRDFIVQNARLEGLQLVPQLPAVRARELWIAESDADAAE